MLGIVNSLFMLSVYLFAVPAMSHFNKLFSLTVGLSVQILSMFLRIFLPAGSIAWAVVSVALFSVGFGPVSYTHLDVYKRQARRTPG